MSSLGTLPRPPGTHFMPVGVLLPYSRPGPTQSEAGVTFHLFSGPFISVRFFFVFCFFLVVEDTRLLF